MTTKSIGYAYATSPNADQFKFKAGCYCVYLHDYENAIPKAVAGFETIDEAKEYADSLPFRFHRSTMPLNV